MENVNDLNRFMEMLRNSTKEQLIGIISSKAQQDTSFELFVKNYLYGSENADDVLKIFLNYAERSRGGKEPDIDIIEAGGNLFLEKMEELTDSVSKIKAYILAANEIDVLLDEGAGMYNDDDWIIVEIAKKCLDKVSEICTSAYISEDKKFLTEAARIIDTAELSTGCTCLDNEWAKIIALVSKYK